MDETKPAGRVTERDREHFRNIGRWKEESHRHAYERHMALSVHERLVVSMAAGIRWAPGWRWPRKDDDPAAFYERARRLGLYRG